MIRYPQRDITQLFNLETDPDERINLADRSEYQEKITEMVSLLKEAQSQVRDTVSFTAKTIRPAAYDPDTLKRKPDQWQPEYVLKRYFSLSVEN